MKLLTTLLLLASVQVYGQTVTHDKRVYEKYLRDSIEREYQIENVKNKRVKALDMCKKITHWKDAMVFLNGFLKPKSIDKFGSYLNNVDTIKFVDGVITLSNYYPNRIEPITFIPLLNVNIYFNDKLKQSYKTTYTISKQ